MRRILPLVVLVLFALGVLPVNASRMSRAQSGNQPAAGAALSSVKEFKLENGLTLLVIEKPDVTDVACYSVYNVGGCDEWAGVTGLSHFTEHLLFKGSTTINAIDYAKEIPLLKYEDDVRAALQLLEDDARFLVESGRDVPLDTLKKISALRAEASRVEEELKALIRSDEFDNLFTAAGGTSLNADTWMHRTMYMVTLPANKLELFYWIEADRLSNAVFRQFYKERDVVLDERLRSVENLSSGRIFESALASISEGCTLGSPVLGWPSDMRRYTRPQQLAFWRTFYRPDNAAIVLVGKVDAGEALSLAKRYFGAIPGPETELPRRVKRNENPVGRRKFVGHHDSTPQVALAWSTPGAADAHYVPLDMLARLLNLQSGPLHKRLVDTSKAEGVGVSFYGSKESGMFVIVAVPMAGVSLESIQKEMEQLLEEIRLGGILKEDFESARSQIIVEQTAMLEQSENLASLLCESFANGDWRALFENNVRAASLTVDDLARSASAALPANHATLLLALKSDSNVPATPPLLEIPGVPEAGTDTVEIARAAIAEAEKRFDADHFEARQWYDGLAARAIYRQAR